MVAKQRCFTGKPPEENKASKALQKDEEWQQGSQTVAEVEDTHKSKEIAVQEWEPMLDFPFRKSDGNISDLEKLSKGQLGFQNQAPLQADEWARELLKNTLQHPTSLTAEDLLNGNTHLVFYQHWLHHITRYPVWITLVTFPKLDALSGNNCPWEKIPNWASFPTPDTIWYPQKQPL